jgi:hypothetical protein
MWPALISGALIVGVGQVGRIPVPDRYRGRVEASYARAAHLARTEARRADVVILGNSRVYEVVYVGGPETLHGKRGERGGVAASIPIGIVVGEMSRDLDLPGLRGRRPTVVNLGVSAGMPLSSLSLWHRISATPRLQAKLLVVGIAPIDLTDESPGRDYAVQHLLGVSDALLLAREGRLRDAAAILTYRAFPLYARRQSVRNLLACREFRELLPRRKGEARGLLNTYFEWYQGYDVSPLQARLLEELILDARARGVRVVMVAMPIGPALLDLAMGGRPPPGSDMRFARPARALRDRTKTPLDVFDSAIARVVQDTDVTYFDYLTPQEVARFDYIDPSHLTRAASLPFTRELAQRINRELAESSAAGPESP